MSLKIEQCKKYKEWELFQFGDGDYWDLSLNAKMNRDFTGFHGTSSIVNEFAYPYIPTLEEQLAFAFKSCQDKCCKRDRHYAYIEIKKQYREIKGEWEIVTVVEGAWRGTDKGNCMYGFITDKFTDSDAQQAMFKLQEYISEAKDGQ